jgi:hypothetical protein
MRTRHLLLGLIGAVAFAAPTLAQSPLETVMTYNNAAQATISCVGPWSAAQEDAFMVKVLAATNNAVLAGDELAAIYASRPFMAARISSLGCSDATVVSALNFGKEKNLP